MRRTLLALLALLGYRPEVYRCVECRNELEQAPHPFAVGLGGVLCPYCRGRESGTRVVGVDAQKYLRVFDRGGLAATVRLRISDDLRAELEGLTTAYLRHVAERDLASLRVLRELREGAYDAGS